MDIVESLEVRWFLPADNQARAALEKFFASAQQEDARVDHYLATGQDAIGFKARLEPGKPAKVETKYLVGSLGIVELAPKMSGDLQRWTKLSLELDDPELRRDGAWRSVTKTRQLRKFAVTLATGAAAEVPITQRPDVGCGVEFTRLEYRAGGTDRVEWTFGLEAFGPAAQLLDVLQATCRAITRQPTVPDLPAAWTASYPRWLLDRPR
jgi:hypothetical protein